MAISKEVTANHQNRAYTKDELAFGLAMPTKTSRSWLSKGQALSSRHARSRSAPDSDLDTTTWDLSPRNFHDVQVSTIDITSRNGPCKKQHKSHDHRMALEQDVEELQRKLQNERAVRHALETAMGRASSAISPGHRHLTPKAKELIHEIIILEETVVDLERHALSLYRRFFSWWFSGSSSFFSIRQKTDPQSLKADVGQSKQMTRQDQSKLTKTSSIKRKKNPSMQRRHDSAVTHSETVSKSASFVQPKSWHAPALAEVTGTEEQSHQRSQSQGVTQAKVMKESPVRSTLNDDGPRPLRDYLSETPNKLSEELIRCMSTIYCKLSDPPPLHLTIPESPSSCTSSSTSLSSIHGIFSDGWSPGRCKLECGYEMLLSDPFHVKGKSSSAGAYACMVEVPWISVDKDRLNYAARMLRDYRLMVEQLEKVDPSQLNHHQKLAFWINIYNALLMHAYLAYGIPRNNLKRMTVFQRAAYKVGGHSINAHSIELGILGCRSNRPTQWLQNLLSSGSKFKAGDNRRSYSIEKPEPLVCFALCCGGRSDPGVRAYTAKNVYEELEHAKKEFLQASIGFQAEKKVLLPKMVEWYAREASIPCTGLLEWVSEYVVDEREKEVIQKLMQLRPNKGASHCIEWVPYNFNFRYLLDCDLAARFILHRQ